MKRYTCIESSRATLFVFRHRLDDSSIQASHFNINHAKCGADFRRLSLKAAALNFVVANAERCRLRQEQFAQSIKLRLPTKNRDERAWSILLHLRVGEVAIKRAAFKSLLQHVPVDLRRHVVNVRLDDE